MQFVGGCLTVIAVVWRAHGRAEQGGQCVAHRMSVAQGALGGQLPKWRLNTDHTYTKLFALAPHYTTVQAPKNLQ